MSGHIIVPAGPPPRPPATGPTWKPVPPGATAEATQNKLLRSTGTFATYVQNRLRMKFASVNPATLLQFKTAITQPTQVYNHKNKKDFATKTMQLALQIGWKGEYYQNIEGVVAFYADVQIQWMQDFLLSKKRVNPRIVLKKPSPTAHRALTRVVSFETDSQGSQSSFLSEDDDNIYTASFICQHVFAEEHAKAGQKCGRAYPEAKFICDQCGCCSGLHFKSGNTVSSKNPLHCQCVPKNTCGYYGGRMADGLPCEKPGKGRCKKHAHVLKSKKKMKKAPGGKRKATK